MGRVQRRSGKEIGVLGRGRLDCGVYGWFIQDGEGVEAGGYGVWFAEASTRNFAAPIPESERQSVSRRELRGVPHAILQRRQGELLVVVLDSEYVYQGIMELSTKWRRHGWRVASGEVGHRNLWEQNPLGMRECRDCRCSPLSSTTLVTSLHIGHGRKRHVMTLRGRPQLIWRDTNTCH